MIQLIETEINDIASLREDYFHSLAEFQELYLELLIEQSSVYKIEFEGTPIGYAMKTADHILVEFHVIDRFVPHSTDVFQTIVHDLAIRAIYCKSFDSLLLSCCLTNSYSYRLNGTLFRDYVDSEKVEMNGISIRFAEDKDYPFLLQQEDDLYETPEELERFVGGNNVIMFQRNNQLLGCGYLIRVHPNYNYYDIGMWVNPVYRRQSIATMIISYLKDLCIGNGWTPICGCAFDNIASQKTLEKNGFISKHKLIEFTVRSQC